MKIVRYIDGDPALFRELMGHFLGNTYRLSQRAEGDQLLRRALSRAHNTVFQQAHRAVERSDGHVAVRRNVARILQFIEIPKRLEGRVYDACYNLLDDAHQPVAVRVFALPRRRK